MRNRKEGFTLIELLIVIAIIGILAAVLIPNLLDARRRAVDAGADSCLKEITTAAEVYFIDFDTYAVGTLGDFLPPACENYSAAAVMATSDFQADGYTVAIQSPVGGNVDYEKYVGSTVPGLAEGTP